MPFNLLHPKEFKNILLSSLTAYLSRTSGFTPVFLWGPCSLCFYFSSLCGVVFFLSKCCVLWVQCCQCLWIVHSLLPLWFSLTFILTMSLDQKRIVRTKLDIYLFIIMVQHCFVWFSFGFFLIYFLIFFPFKFCILDTFHYTWRIKMLLNCFHYLLLFNAIFNNISAKSLRQI